MSQEWTEAVKLAVVAIGLALLIGFIMTVTLISMKSSNRIADDISNFSSVTSVHDLNGKTVDKQTARTIARKYYDLLPVFITNTTIFVNEQNNPEDYIKSRIDTNGRYEITVRADRADLNFQTYIVIRKV
jgi:Flp pilus assembly protein TadG